MRKLVQSVVITSCLFICNNIVAKEQLFQPEDTAFLQSSCREVIEIFNKKQETGKYAALHTSMSEAMRAGYCIGVLQQYIKTPPKCKNKYGNYRALNWFDLAQIIVGLSLSAEQLEQVKASSLLKEAFCNG